MIEEIRPQDCDAETPSIMFHPDGRILCRCIVCARCGRHTGDSNQGHYWSYCKVIADTREFHFCCPDGCELEEGA